MSDKIRVHGNPSTHKLEVEIVPPSSWTDISGVKAEPPREAVVDGLDNRVRNPTAKAAEANEALISRD